MIKNIIEFIKIVKQYSKTNGTGLGDTIKDMNIVLQHKLSHQEKSDEMLSCNIEDFIEDIEKKFKDRVAKKDIQKTIKKFISRYIDSGILDVGTKISFEIKFYHKMKTSNLVMKGLSYVCQTTKVKEGNLLFLGAAIGSDDLITACLNHGVDIAYKDEYEHNAAEVLRMFRVGTDSQNKFLITDELELEVMDNKLTGKHNKSSEWDMIYKSKYFKEVLPGVSQNKKLKI